MLLLLLALLAISGRTPAQQPSPVTDDPRAADAPLLKKALTLLETVADQISTLQSPENRARLGSNIAALLWKHDEQRARTLLGSVQSDINTGLQRVDENPRTQTQTRMVFLKLRMDTVERIAKVDAEAALAFLQATEPDLESTRSYEIDEMTRNLELRLANQIAAENPDLALKLGRKSLARGFSTDLLRLLRLLHKKDKEKAASLYKEIVAKLVSNGLTHYSAAFYFAQNLARSYKPPAVDEQAYRELIKLFIDTAFENGCDKATVENNETYFCRELASLLPQMAKVDASRTAELKRWEPNPEQEQSRYDPIVFQEVEEMMQSGTIDEMLELALKYPQQRQQIHWRAITMAEESGDVERARKLVNEHIDDPETRRDILARLDGIQSWLAMTADKLVEAQAILNKIPDQHSKVIFLLHLANQFGAKDRKAALKLLNQASEIIDSMKPGREQTELELSLAMMYCIEKDERGFDRMQSLMPKLNELVAAAIKLDGYDSHNVRDGEWNMSNQGSIGHLLTTLSQGGGYFAWCDFDRALNLAGQFERTEIRLMAQLKLAQAILGGRPKRGAHQFVQFWY